MTINFATICYLPRKGVGHTAAFLQNMAAFPAKHPVYYFSKDWTDQPNTKVLSDNIEGWIKKGADGKPADMVHAFNLIFYSATRMAASKGLTHFLFIEHDCRVGVAGWDDLMLQEMLKKNEDAICAGSPVVFNPSAYNRESAERFERFVSGTRKKPMPMQIAAEGKLGERKFPCVFTLAALSIYNVEWMKKLFPEIMEGRATELAHKTQLHDLEVGQRMWKELGEKAYDSVVWMACSYSGYKDTLSTEEDRKAMLTSGKVVAVHQIKSDWAGPEVLKQNPTSNA